MAALVGAAGRRRTRSSRSGAATSACRRARRRARGAWPIGLNRYAPSVRADLVELGEVAPVRVGVARREARDLLERPVEVEPVRERLAVREDDVGDRVGIDVREAVLRLEAELVVAQHRVRLDQRVPGRARVEAEARDRQLLGRGGAARDRPRVEDEHLVPRLGQIARGDQAVVPAARDDDVRGRAHVDSSPLGCRAPPGPARLRAPDADSSSGASAPSSPRSRSGAPRARTRTT